MSAATTAATSARLGVMLTELRLPTMKRLVPEVCAQSDREGWPGHQLVETLLEHEMQKGILPGFFPINTSSIRETARALFAAVLSRSAISVAPPTWLRPLAVFSTIGVMASQCSTA